MLDTNKECENVRHRWGKKVKKGKGVKKGKKGKKSLVDKGHKNTGFKTVYHKEEWGKSSKVSCRNMTISS